MARTVVSEEHVKFAKKNYLKMAASDIDKKFGVSKGCTHRIYKKLGIQVPKDVVKEFILRKNIGKTTYTKEEDDFIRKHYLSMPVNVLARTMGRSTTGINNRLKRMNLVIPPEIIEQRKQDSLLKPGLTPPNKGKKLSPEAYAKLKPTMFKKGHVPANTMYDGHERQYEDGYVYVRVRQGKYVQKHHLIWKEHHGEIPEGHLISFKNGNKADFRIENLECISLQENMTRNSMHRFPEDLRKIIQLKGAVKRQINRIEKHGSKNQR